MKLRRTKTSSEEISGFLDRGTALTGELQFTGTLRIDGHFHGSVNTGDVLVIGEHAVVHADIKAGEVEIHGRVFGNIDAKRRVEVHPTGRVQGDLRVPLLILTAGAQFDGTSHMATEEETATPEDNRDLIGQNTDEAH